MRQTAFIALGSNLGDRARKIREAVGLLEEVRETAVECRSPLYESEPAGYADQGWFLNGVVQVETALTPIDLLKSCQAIEDRLGRRREFPNGPRTIDLDLLFFEDRVIDEPSLTLPHPRLHLRGFVLQPLCDVNPNWRHPILGKTVGELRSELDDRSGLRLYPEGEE